MAGSQNKTDALMMPAPFVRERSNCRDLLRIFGSLRARPELRAPNQQAQRSADINHPNRGGQPIFLAHDGIARNFRQPQRR